MTKPSRQAFPTLSLPSHLAGQVLRLAIRSALAATLLVAAVGKLWDPTGFATILRLYGISWPGYAAAAALSLEVAAGGLLLIGFLPLLALPLTGILLAVYWWATLFGAPGLIGCGCFGTVGPRLTYGQHVTLLILMTLAWGYLSWPRFLAFRRVPAERPSWWGHFVAPTCVLTIVLTASLTGGQWLGRSAIAAEASQPFESITALMLDGKLTSIDATKAPVLFVASWCPHCHELLSDMARGTLPVRPIIISTLFHGGTFEENRDLTLRSLRSAGIRPEDDWQIYLDAQKHPLVQAVPTLGYVSDGRWHLEPVAFPQLKTALAHTAGQR